MDRRQTPPWAIVLACVLPLVGFWTYGLFDLDEGFYAAVVRDMMQRQDWVTPTMAGVPWFEKPILAYWLAIPSVMAFGDDWGPRLPSILCTLATILVLFKWTCKNFGSQVAVLAALLYSGNLLVAGLGRMMMTDAPLALLLTLAMTRLSDWRTKEDCPGWLDWTLIGLYVGLGVLAKGPVAFLLFGGTFLVSSFVIQSFKGAWKSAWLLGVFVMACVIAVWYVPCALENGRPFVEEFLVRQNFGRFAGGDKAHSLPLWGLAMFPLVLAVGFGPFLFLGLRRLGPVVRKLGTGAEAYLKVWFLVPLVFFTISGTKLPHYILPSVAPMSVLLAIHLTNLQSNKAWDKWAMGWCAGVFLLLQLGMGWYWRTSMEEFQEPAKIAAKKKIPLYVYKVGGSGDTSLSLQVRRTSHPSVFFYAGTQAHATDNPKDWLSAESGLILTYKDFLGEVLASRPGLAMVPTPRAKEAALVHIGMLR